MLDNNQHRVAAELLRRMADRGGHGVFGPGLKRLVDDIRVMSSVTASTLESHMDGCDTRYKELAEDQKEWRVELGKRLDKQDSAQNKILWTMLSIAVGMLAIVLETIVRGFNVHFGG